jgi:hypothetical protein
MAISKDDTPEIGTTPNADPPKPKSNRGGRRLNQTGRPPSVLRPNLTSEQTRRLNALARNEGVTPTQKAEEHLGKWLDSESVGEDVETIERWERFEKGEKEDAKKAQKKKANRAKPKKLPASQIKVYR